MHIEKIHLRNYRNYETLTLDFSPKINVFIGENAQGKTNLLEAIYFMAVGKSFRTSKDGDLIEIEKEGAYVKLLLSKNKDQQKRIEIGLDRSKNKKCKVNGVPLDRMSELLGTLNVVIFSPEDLQIIKQGPSQRRDFIDGDLSQITPKYHFLLNQYQKILKQRNQALKLKQYRKVDLEPWNMQLVQYGTEIIFYRREFIKGLSILTRLMHRKITREKENLKLIYQSSVPLEKDQSPLEIKSQFLKSLKEAEAEEINRGLTLIGPHRDDLEFEINGKDVKKYGSQGQQRTTVLSLKMAELELMKKETGEYPVLLLDDVMSELDENRQQDLLQSLKNIQTFITSTSMDSMEKIDEMNLYQVQGGKIKILQKPVS